MRIEFLSLRKIVLALTMACLIVITLFAQLPIVKADIVLTSEFFEPLKNWSFEERAYGPPYPCGGIYNCASWTTSTGGSRYLAGDIEPNGGDGDSDIYDVITAAIAFGSVPSSPNWNPDADIDGDGDVDIFDIVKIADSYGDFNALDGNYSWYADAGEQIYSMSQSLDSDTLSQVKSRKITFGFWYRPKSVTPDGYTNRAWAEIYFRKESGTGGAAGSTIYPTETEWFFATVSCFIPSTAVEVRVRIIGGAGFEGWIDFASLSITEDSLTTEVVVPGLEEKLSLAVNLFESKDYSLPTAPCRAFLGVGLAANISKYEDDWYFYGIDYVELEIRMFTGASVTIRNVTQSNNIDEVTDPDQTEEVENRWIVGGSRAIEILVAFGVFSVGYALGLGPIGGLALDIAGIGATDLILSTYQSDADEPFTDDPEDSARARISYQSFPTFANERSVLELAWNRGGNCRIDVTARVQFYLMNKGSGQIAPLDTLEDTISITVST